MLQPEPHVHLAVHRRRSGDVLLRLLALARAPVELAEAEVAVGDERAHGELVGQIQSVAVVLLTSLGPGATPRDLTQKAEGMRLASPRPQPACERQRLVDAADRLIDPPGSEIAHANQHEDETRSTVQRVTAELFDRLRYRRAGFGETIG